MVDVDSARSVRQGSREPMMSRTDDRPIHRRSQRLPIVDGLRALAVLAVVLFHSFPAFIRGGFIGVDIFFVISGFIISLRYMDPLVLREVDFKFFFVRRICRLLPAYVALIAIITVVAILLLPPRELTNYGISLWSQGIYAQNIAFWNIGDYFDKALSKPLLHTWSLGVEEQFYMLFPLIILSIRWRPKFSIYLLAFVSIVSLLVGNYVLSISPKTSFYLLPFRVWEFLAGIFTAMIFQRLRTDASPVLSNIAGLVGVAMMLAAIFLFESRAAFPGPQSLLAVAGCALVCLSQKFPRHEVLGFFELPFIQHFGRISYSWYLWHWPPICFFYILTGHVPDLLEAFLLLLLGYGLGAASFVVLENWGLSSPWLKSPKISFSALGIFLSLTASTGALVVFERGFLQRYPRRQQLLYAAQMDTASYRCPLIRRFMALNENICRLNNIAGPKAVLIIGDSHADQSKQAIIEIGDRNHTGVYMTKQNCQLIDYYIPNKEKPYCTNALWQAIKADMAHHNITKIIAISHWPADYDMANVHAALEQIAGSGLKLYIELPPPESPLLDPDTRLHSSSKLSDASDYTVSDHKKFRGELDDVIRSIAATHPNVTVLDPVPELCGKQYCDASENGRPLYNDSHHLDTVGVKRISRIYDVAFH